MCCIGAAVSRAMAMPVSCAEAARDTTASAITETRIIRVRNMRARYRLAVAMSNRSGHSTERRRPSPRENRGPKCKNAPTGRLKWRARKDSNLCPPDT